MSIIKSKLKKSDSPKPKDQSLAIAYETKKRAGKKKMAAGGSVSAKSEARPMPSTRGNDAHEVALNGAKKALQDAGWSSDVTVRQAQKPSLTRLSQPKMVGSDVFSVRNRDMRDDENDLGSRIPPESDKAQPIQRDNEDGPNRRGVDAKDLHMKRMADGGEVEPSPTPSPEPQNLQGAADDAEADLAAAQKAHDIAQKRLKMANGGMIDADHSGNKHHSAVDSEYGDGAEEDELEEPSGLQDSDDQDAMPVDEYMAGHFAEGGDIDLDEMEDEHHSSIAAAIMSKKRIHAEDSDSDEDRMLFADGGEVDLSRNADEDPNEEDQMSYQALKKENYSESEGLDQLDQPEDSNEHGDEREDSRRDKHDMISSIRAAMKRKQFRK